MKHLTASNPVYLPGFNSNGNDYLCDIFEQEGGKKTLYAVAHGITIEEARDRAINIIRLARKNALMLKTIRKAFASMDSLNNGGFGPLTNHEDIEVMLELNDIIDDADIS